MEVIENPFPFKYPKEVLQYIPDVFITEKDTSICNVDSWFVKAPKYTTFRFNTNKYNSQQIIDLVNQQLLEEAKTRNTVQPKIFLHKDINDCIVILNWHQDKVENGSTDYQVIIDVPCANAVLRGADIFAPGILSLSHDAKIGDRVNIFADIEKKCRRGFHNFKGKTVFIGYGVVQMTRHQLFKNNCVPRGIGVLVTYNLSGIPRLKFSEDAGILQNFPSILCGHLFANINGQILDMCAAPGNKTTHIASLLGDKGEVTALDKTPDKVARIGRLCDKLGITNVRYYPCNSTKCIAEESYQVGSNGGPPYEKESFSAVLLDPPCSGLGQRPSLMNQITASQLKSFVSLQRKLFQSAVDALRDGGLLVYSTCTITLDENEEMVSWALKKFPDLNLKKIEPAFGHFGLEKSALDEKERRLVSRFGYPRNGEVDEDTIGFFIACFYKQKIKQ